MYLIYINIQKIGGTWPVLLGLPDLSNCPIVKGVKTDGLVYSRLYHGNDSAYFTIFLYIIIFTKLSILYNLYVVSKSLYNKSFILLVKVNEKMN